MLAKVSLEKTLYVDKYWLVINDDYYIEITKQHYHELATYLGINIGEKNDNI